MLCIGREHLLQGGLESGDGAARAGNYHLAIVNTAMRDLTRDHPLLEAGVQELIGVHIEGSHGAIVGSEDNKVKPLIIKQLAVGHRCEVGALELWGHVVNLESLKLRGGHLELVDVEETLIAYYSELNELPCVHIGVNSDGIDSRSVLYEAAADYETRLEVPDRQVVLSLHTQGDQMLTIIGECQGLDTTLVEGVPLDQLPVLGVVKIDE